MPFSDSQGKDQILAWVKEIRQDYASPITVLDIGPGCGTYSDLIRPYGLTWQFNAMEIWEPYIDKFDLDDKYDYVFIEDAREAAGELDFYDLVILGDVIEHMTKDEAKALILKLASPDLQNDNIIISFPELHLDQGPYEGNPYETHVEHWTFDDMVDFCSENDLLVYGAGSGGVLAWFWLKPRHAVEARGLTATAVHGRV